MENQAARPFAGGAPPGIGTNARSLRTRMLLVLLGVTFLLAPLLLGVQYLVVRRAFEDLGAAGTLVSLAISSSVSMLLFILAVAMVMDRTVMQRVRAASDAIAHIAHSRDFSLRLPAMGPLTDDFNAMMEELERATTERAEQEGRVRAILANSSDAITVVTADGTVLYATSAVREVWGCEPEALVGGQLCDRAQPDNRAALSSAIQRSGGGEEGPITIELRTLGERVVEAVLSKPAASMSGMVGVVVNTRDVTERAELQARLREQAYHDGLTDLPNRRLFMEELTAAVRRGDESLALFFLDLDDFKLVNDTLGHAAGDAVLVEMAHRLSAATRTGDLVGRLGGDEFVLLLSNVRAATAQQRAEEIAEVVRRPIWVGERMVSLSPSIGIAVNSGGRKSGDELLREADAALYRAKAASRTSSVLLDPTLSGDWAGREPSQSPMDDAEGAA